MASGQPTVWPPMIRHEDPAPDQDGYPVVRWVYPYWEGGRALVPGDVLLRVGSDDLAGARVLELTTRLLEHARTELPVPVTVRRGEMVTAVALDVRRPHPIGTAPAWSILYSVGAVATGVLVLLRAPDARAARPLFLGLVSLQLYLASFFPGPPGQTYAGLLARALGVMVTGPCFLQAMLLLVPETAPKSRLGLWWPWLLAPLMLSINASVWLGTPFPADFALRWLDPIAHGALALGVLVVLTRSFRLAGPVGRRRIKWVALGCYLIWAPRLFRAIEALFGYGVDQYTLMFGNMPVSGMLLPASGMLLPACLLIAVVRYNLFDIDRLFSATVSYTVLAVLLLAGALTVVPTLAAAAGTSVGMSASSAQLVLSLALASLVVPAHRRLRPQIERLFFRERYTLERGVESLHGELTTCDTPERLLELSGERLDELLRPESCVIYTRAGDAYAPAFVRGRAIPPAFDAQSPLIAALRTRDRPLVAERWAAAGLRPFDRAALETLGVAVVLPIRRGTELLGFLCLGGKRSGDVYTSTDVALLGSVAHAVSRELLRFDDAEIIRQSSAMQEALRRYVPAPVAARVVGGVPLQAGERQVSVLFVDIRGYTTYAEGRKSESIFRTTNRFIQTVARIVREHGGTVVEFTGDGLMAVFGAPESLAQKERAAVEAGRDLITAVGSVEVEDAGPLSVGVGIATGPVWVGDVHAFDHAIWTVVGNTTNLAARLQALTRELEAAVVIDAATWREAGYVAADLVPREAVPIRGRSEPEDVYLLPLVASRARR